VPSIPSHGRPRCRKTVGADRHSVSTAYLRPSELLKHNGLKSLIFEDSRPFTSRGGQRILSPARLPVPPLSPDAISIRYHTLFAAALLQFSQCSCYRDPTFHRALWLTQPGVWPPGIWAVPPCNASTARPEVSLWAGCSET